MGTGNIEFRLMNRNIILICWNSLLRCSRSLRFVPEIISKSVLR